MPLLLYVHVPFCTSKCHFCDWVTGISPSDLRLPAVSPRRRAYVAALVRQIDAEGPALARAGYRPRILYFGGGTASALEIDEFETVMAALQARFGLDDLLEATMECSPETLTREKLAAYKRAGIRRLSIGVQSMNDERLRRIGRSHNAAAAAAALELAAEAGFEDVNVDIISGLPDDSLGEFERSLDELLRHPFSHCSLYPYRAAPGTVMVRQQHKSRAGLTWLEEQLAAYRTGHAMLVEHGLPEYAMGHFGRMPCHSDLAYFRLDMDWIGFGAGATSICQGRYRMSRRGEIDRYSSDPMQVDEDVPASDPAVVSRLAYQALTTIEGIERGRFEQRLRAPLETLLAAPGVRDLFAYFRSLGVLIEDHDRVRIRRESIAEVFIRLLFLNSPRESRRQAGARALLGAS